MIETHYVMEDGSTCHPRDVKRGADGSLQDKNGRKVAMRGDVPRSRSVDSEEKVETVSREVKPEPARRGYRTRQSVAEPVEEPKPEETPAEEPKAEETADEEA